VQQAPGDDQWLEAARAGDRRALERLLSGCQDRVYRTALGYLGGNEEAAMEVAQDVLISVARNLGQFRGESRFTTWLYRMTMNYAKNHQVASNRRSARFVSLTPASTTESGDEQERPRDLHAGGISAREAAAQAESVSILHARLQQLPEEFRSVLMLRFIEDQSYEEIAEALAVPVGTVKSRINRGRGELRRLMADVLTPGEVGG